MQIANTVSRISGYLQQRSSNPSSMLTRKGHSIYPFSVVVWKCKDKPIATGRSRSNRTNEVNPHMKPWWMNRDWMQLRVRGKWLPTGSLTDITSSNLYSVLMIISHLHAARVNEQKIKKHMLFTSLRMPFHINVSLILATVFVTPKWPEVTSTWQACTTRICSDRLCI